MGGSKHGTCQCVPEWVPPARPSPTKDRKPPPPPGRYCDSVSDCDMWTCRDGSKPMCDTQASGDPFTKNCRCG
ncbi:Aromatic-ring hydroxylase-like [Purpureocillium lavendulum]|uniref:Aromatic-ring hydroxylase-like n=1 Tax=Purpureocillium lavendulum TaxID=1247861 RepID=A0AB34FFP3_9HYPO|nr:Aromatic-ring hydroxylase-like [Purpureocillium lavendulum]